MTLFDLRNDVSFLSDYQVDVSVTGPGYDLWDAEGNLIDSFETSLDVLYFVEYDCTEIALYGS